MEWFKQFYITGAMAAAGIKSIWYKGAVNQHEKSCDLERKENPKCKPREMLSLPAWSMMDGPLDLNSSVTYTNAFTKETLTNICRSCHNEGDPPLPTEREDLVEAVDGMLDNEWDNDVGIHHHSKMWLMMGVLCQKNWEHLDDIDVAKLALAHGVDRNLNINNGSNTTKDVKTADDKSKDVKAPVKSDTRTIREVQIMGILESQVILLQEMYDKGWDEHTRVSKNTPTTHGLATFFATWSRTMLSCLYDT
jgi:hypothetical protein